MRQVLRCLFLLQVITAPLSAQNFSGGFRFYLPPRDTIPGDFLPSFEQRFLSDEDAISIGPLGHFRRSGERIRFFGTNLSAGACFPQKDDAASIAGRMRKMGFNLVRFHHMDNPWGDHIFAPGNGTRQLDPEMLDRVRYLLYQLRRNGVYANINLHVSRTFSETDGVADAEDILNYGKGVTLFDPQLIALQKEYAAALLTGISPYTGTALVDDPVMAMVEIVNENSLYRMWRDDALKPQREGGDLIDRHDLMLDILWREYLTARYPSTDSLRTAWRSAVSAGEGEELVYRGSFENNPNLRRWQLEEHEGAAAVMAVDAADPGEGTVSAKLSVQAANGTSWHVQWKQAGLSLEQDSVYTLSFLARSDGPKSPAVSLMKETAPWTMYGTFSFDVFDQWQAYTFSFKAPETNTGDVRLSFQLGGSIGTFWFDLISLRTSSIRGLGDDESFASENIKRIDYSDALVYSDGRVRDMSMFYLALQNDFFADMYDYLKNDLGVKVPIIGTNWNVGPADLVVQSICDIIDNHGYWDHPSFPDAPWSPTDWLIANEPMVTSFQGGTIPLLMGGVGSTDKPFIISEYNHAFPNRFQTEGPLFLAAYGSFHDLDGLLMFDYAGDNGSWEADLIEGFFDIQRNPAMMSLMPSCAAAFRNGLITTAVETIELRYTEDDILLLPKHDAMSWTGPETFPRQLALEHAVRNASFTAAEAASGGMSALSPAGPPWTSDTGQLNWDPGAGVFTAVSPAFIAAAGYLDSFSGGEAGIMQIQEASGFFTLTWLSLSGDPLASAPFSLLTLSSRAQNHGMIWDGTGTVHDRWGSEPVTMKPESCRLRLGISADTLLVYPLDERGNGAGTGYLYEKGNGDFFEIEIDQTAGRTVWFGLEARGVGDEPGNGESESELPLMSVDEPFPNPAVPGASGEATWLSYRLSASARVRITVLNSIGRTVRSIWNGNRGAGEYLHRWDGDDTEGRKVGSGLYLVVFQAETGGRRTRTVKKCAVMH